LNKRREPKPGEIYQHFKTNNFYVILDVGSHTETKERLVSYTEIDSPIDKEPYKRPLEMFIGELPYEQKIEYEKINRFEKVNILTCLILFKNSSFYRKMIPLGLVYEKQ